ncbi:hypothetical protein OC844_006037, partial [Tilletia horrida]
YSPDWTRPRASRTFQLPLSGRPCRSSAWRPRTSLQPCIPYRKPRTDRTIELRREQLEVYRRATPAVWPDLFEDSVRWKRGQIAKLTGTAGEEAGAGPEEED